MRRRTELGPDETMTLQRVLTSGPDEMPPEHAVAILGTLRQGAAERTRLVDAAMVEHLGRMRVALNETRASVRSLKELNDRLLAPSWHPATFVRAVETATGPRALVVHEGSSRAVGTAADVSLDAFGPGDRVFLTHELNAIVGKAPGDALWCGETAVFERLTGGRAVLKSRDERVIVDVSASLRTEALEKGDLVRWDRSAWMAVEKVEADRGGDLLLDDVPEARAEDVGGHRKTLERLLSALRATLLEPEKAQAYGLPARQSILLVGPEGTGKTLMARVAAAELSRLSGRRCPISVVKASAWESPWVGETQQNIIRVFEAVRRAACGGIALLFIDEIEAIGRIRGAAADRHGDKFLASLLLELDGFKGRDGVAVLAATNRKDLIDPALLSRISDLELTVGRPDLNGAREIFAVHLPLSTPFGGSRPEDERSAAIEAAVSRLYAPNADNAVATLRFRDGTTRTIAARELASGRLIEQVCRSARRRAFERDMQGGSAGVRAADLEEAVAEAVERLSSTLSPVNVRSHLVDLSSDTDVVSVVAIRRRVRRHRYLYRAA